MFGKIKTIIMVVAIIFFIIIGVSACSKAVKLPEDPIKITITSSPDHKTIAYELLPNRWHNAVFDRPHYKEVLFEKLSRGEVNLCQVGDTITFDFGEYQPQKLVLKSDRYTDRLNSFMPPIIEIPLEGNNFKLQKDYAGPKGMTFFTLTATWDESNEIEYAFVVHINDPDNPSIPANAIQVSDESKLVRFIITDKGDLREYYPVQEKEGKKGLLTADKKELLPCEFEGFMAHYNMIAAQKDGKWHLYDYNGTRLSDEAWDDILKTTTPMDNEVNGLVKVQKNGVWGCINQQGKIVITPNWDDISLNYYEEVEPFIRVMKYGKYGYITYDGQMVLKPEWDMAIMDVLAVPTNDLIFVRKNDEWGTVKVVNDKAGEVDWTKKPREEIQFGFMQERYELQAQTMHDLLDPYLENGKVSSSTIHFFYDYYSKNDSELLYLPDFGQGKKLDWDLLTKFVYTRAVRTAQQKGVLSVNAITQEEFDSIAQQYFDGINYTHQSSQWLTYKDGKYTPTGWSDHGFRKYYLSELDRTVLGDNNYKYRAKLIGYQFWEEDFNEGTDNKSPNMKVIKTLAQDPQYKNRSLNDVLTSIMSGDPTKVLTPAVELTMEFTINQPTADVWLKYLSAHRKEIANL